MPRQARLPCRLPGRVQTGRRQIPPALAVECGRGRPSQPGSDTSPAAACRHALPPAVAALAAFAALAIRITAPARGFVTAAATRSSCPTGRRPSWRRWTRWRDRTRRPTSSRAARFHLAPTRRGRDVTCRDAARRVSSDIRKLRWRTRRADAKSSTGCRVRGSVNPWVRLYSAISSRRSARRCAVFSLDSADSDGDSDRTARSARP